MKKSKWVVMLHDFEKTSHVFDMKKEAMEYIKDMKFDYNITIYLFKASEYKVFKRDESKMFGQELW